MVDIYSVNFFCHGCGLENTFNFQCEGDLLDARDKASNFACPSGCNPSRSVFELTHFQSMDWLLALEAKDAVFH
jgi:hypothetical protein